MRGSNPGYQQFFAELKRRHVFRVMAVYGIVGFVLLQVVDLAVPALLLPAWTYRFAALFLMLGFPVALILAWAFEMTPEGVRRARTASDEELREILAAPASQRLPSGLMALVGVAALVFGAWWVGSRSGAQAARTAEGADRVADVQLALADPVEDQRPSIAVLPFADMSPEGDQEYFSDGMTEEILNVLAKVRDLRVSARTSAFAFKGGDLTAEQLGDTLRVSYLVEGSVRKAGDQLRITAQLIDTSDGSHLWSDQYDRELNDVFAIQTEIAEAIAHALRVPLGLGEEELLVTPTADLEAYDLYLAGRARMRERGSSVLEAVDLFAAAIRRDSTWAPAWAGLAESTALVPFYDETASDSAGWADHLGAAEAAAMTALDIDPRNGSATVALGNVYRDRWEWGKAEAAYQAALTIDPDNVEAHQQYAEFLAYVGRLDEALRAAHRALGLDRSPIRLNVAGYVSEINGHSEEAIELFREGIRLDPEGRVHFLKAVLSRVYLDAGRWEEWWSLTIELAAQAGSWAVSEIQEAWPEPGPPPAGLDVGALPLFPPGLKALLWLELGRPDEALAALGELADVPPFGHTIEVWHPRFDSLRDDPRFEAILERRGLAGRRPIRAALPAASS
ncbi:MAG: tetratricopeptide repeat protein, partial [Gemmatimonadota bacterium]